MTSAPAPRFAGAAPPVAWPKPSSAGGGYRAASSVLPAEVRRHAGFWIRLAAGMIDGLLLAVPLVILESRLGPGIRLLALVTWLYFPLLESSAGQATIGKLVCGLRVTDTYGRPISFARACGRYWAKLLSTPFGLGYLMIAWTAQKRGLHDFVAGTLVLRRG